jgi:photosystem II stability/assembly factor-like uncharacterized protein
MKKITYLFLLFFAISQAVSATAVWQKLNMTKAAGGTINLNISRMQLEDGKLYAATYDGIWVSPSANGGDWQPYGLQGQKVTRLSFGDLKLAEVLVTASNDATKMAAKLYKHNGTIWVVTNLNPTTVSTFGSANSSFTQIKDNTNKTIILYPTWGGGIWRSEDGGDTWTNYAQQDTDYGKVYKNVLGLFSFPGDNVVYGTDKVSNGDNFMIYSEDYGATWNNKYVGSFFNPHAVYARTYNNKKYVYFGGENGNAGAVWRSEDMGKNWEPSFSSGVEFWQCREITASPNGNLYSMASVNNLYVSKDNGDSFESFATGLTVPAYADRVANPPGGDKYFFSDVIATNAKVYLSTIYQEGIYVVDLSTDLNNAKNSTLKYKLLDNTLQINTAENTKIQIINSTGSVIGTYKAQSAISHINIAHLAPSVYMLKAVATDNTFQINKFIKQ